MFTAWKCWQRVGFVIVKSEGKIAQKAQILEKLGMYSIDPADNEDALKINICEDSSGAAPALNIHS